MTDRVSKTKYLIDMSKAQELIENSVGVGSERRECLVDIELERVEIDDFGRFVALTFKMVFR